MPLLLVDLDNTLVDRDAAFRAASVEFLTTHGLPTVDVDWIMRVDASGYRPRAVVAQALRERYASLDAGSVQAFIDRGAADFVTLPEATRFALRHAVTAGWTPVVVTNGSVTQQEAKLRISGLASEVAGWVISEGVGVKKPSRAIFDAAAASVGARLEDGGWVIGDAPQADIAGAVGVGLPSVWLHLGRTWPSELPFQPTHVADHLPAALDHILTVTRS
ncbi:HAD family hydrolase [Actinopolymorpha alba]|uniref:HAD family hydrolase n=1 Tax=Actinopolymorpha alba TaxID=533267 RepID=UPI000377446E|nr:HAD family hydrolase [Actinopolymorpha alba]